MTNQQATYVPASYPEQIVIGPVLWDFINVFEPYTYSNGDKKYTINLIVSRDDVNNKNKIIKAIENVYIAGYKQLAEYNSFLKNNPLRKSDFDLMVSSLLLDEDKNYEYNPLYKHSVFLRVKNAKAPFVCDKTIKEIDKTTKIYSGAKGNAVITFHSYTSNAKIAMIIVCSVDCLQLIENGPCPSSNINVINILKNFNQEI